MSDRLREALDYWDGFTLSQERHYTLTGDQVLDLKVLLSAARKVLAGPSLEAVQAAARSMFDADDAYEAYEWSADVGAWYERMAAAALAAAWATDFGGDDR